jgi:hypothetical protein
MIASVSPQKTAIEGSRATSLARWRRLCRWPRQSMMQCTVRAKARAGATPRIHRGEYGDLLLGQHVAGRLEREPGAGPRKGLTKPLDYAGDRRKAERLRDLATKAARRDENEPPNSLGAFEQHRLRDSAAEGVTGHVNGIETERFEPPGQDARVPAELVARVGMLGEAVPWKVRYEDTPVAHE